MIKEQVGQTIISNTCETSRKLVTEGAARQPQISVRGRFACCRWTLVSRTAGMIRVTRIQWDDRSTLLSKDRLRIGSNSFVTRSVSAWPAAVRFGCDVARYCPQLYCIRTYVSMSGLREGWYCYPSLLFNSKG